MRNPPEVIITDNKCTMEDYLKVGQKGMNCAKEHGYTDEEKTVKEELCEKLKDGAQNCILGLKVDCFSERENDVLTDLLKTAFKDRKEFYGTELGKKVLKKMKPYQREIFKCVLRLEENNSMESGQPSVTIISLFITPLFYAIL